MSTESRGSDLIALGTTLALAVFCAFHWAHLVADPPIGRVIVAVLIAGALGLVLQQLPRPGWSQGRTWAAGTVLAALALGAGLLAAGLELRLLAPGHWDELGRGIGDGISGLGSATYSYAGGGRWPYQVLLLALPLILTLAFAIRFWPGPDSRWRTWGGVGILVAAYGIASVLYAPNLPVLHGAILLVLVAACLWAPELRGPRFALAAATVGLAALVAVPVAVALDRERPVLNYRSWTWTGGEPNVSFAWNHSYGPLDWPRQGTALLEVRSPEAHYWRSIVLERFDGFGWVRSDTASSPMELPNTIEGGLQGGVDGHIRDDWYRTTQVTVRELRSGLVVAPGSPQTVRDLEGSIASDGTTFAGELPASGQTYQVVSYAPDPTVEELEGSPASWPESLRRFTQLELPSSRLDLGQDLPQLDDQATGLVTEQVDVPLWGEPRPALARAAAESGYGEVFAISQRLSRQATSPYELVRGVEQYLDRGFSYSEEPAESNRPLRSFLLQQKTGYCQQFSGAMSLLLRMAGIPTRVVSGFSPGAPDLDKDNVYVVRDTDAHSWVEVYFSGIGWVPFDPTPGTSPAESQSTNLAAAASPAASSEQPGAREREPELSDRGTTGNGAVDEGGSPAATILILLLAGLLAAAAIAATVRRRRFGALRPDEMLTIQARELAAAAEVARYRSGPGSTLLQLENRLRAGGRTRAAGYAARIGEARFAAERPKAPDLDERRTVRRDLSRSQGLRIRLRMLAAIPPGAPRQG